MNRPKKDLLFVCIQLLLFLWYAVPIWRFPSFLPDPLQWIGIGMALLGIVLILIAMLQLNRHLSPFPSPTSDSQLIQHGLFAWIRHPIYSGIVLGALGWGLYSDHGVRIGIGVLLLFLFYVKASYEEQLLKDRFEAYESYMKKTGMFFPIINSQSSLFLLLLFLPFVACQEASSPSWEKTHPGIWQMTIGDPATINLLEAADALPKTERLAQFEEQDFPLDQARVHIRRQKGKLSIQLPLDQEEQLYGLGLHFQSVHRRKKIYRLHVDHYGGKDNGRTHAPVPFYVSSKGYGVLINSARYLDMYMGTGIRQDSPNPPTVYDRNTDREWQALPYSDNVEILIPDDKAEMILFSGSSLMEVVQKYNLYSGGGCLPPKWGLGFTYRTHTKYSDEEVLKEVDAFEEQGFPLDFIGLEPGWMNRSYPCSYEWDEGRFPDPKQFVQSLLDKGVRTNLWMNPYVAPKAELYPQLLPYSGTHTVWNGIVPDYSLQPARDIFSAFYLKHQLDIGVSGLKIDEVDGYDFWIWPDVAQFPSGLDAEQMRQTYGLLVQDMVEDVYRTKNIRTYGLTRASNAGASRLPFVIYNDYYKHEDFITALVNSGFSGLLWTPEARNSPSGEEWLRRMQAVCFSPMAMINAWSSGTRPWSYPEVYEQVKEVALLRMQLLPYIYSTFAAYHFDGIPPIRPLPLLEGFQSSKEIKDQYMFGDNLLVAPVFAGQTEREVILPAGKWYDFYSGELVGENEGILLDTRLDQIPLFVRDGGLIPMIPARLHAPSVKEMLPLEVRHYGEAPGEFFLYEDDGVSFGYEKGAFSWTQLSFQQQATGSWEGSTNRIAGDIFGYGPISWTNMSR
ncbi:MAG: TIM-barrel domain-containing protein [Bacteroidota bacterium]